MDFYKQKLCLKSPAIVGYMDHKHVIIKLDNEVANA